MWQDGGKWKEGKDRGGLMPVCHAVCVIFSGFID